MVLLLQKILLPCSVGLVLLLASADVDNSIASAGCTDCTDFDGFTVLLVLTSNFL